MPMYILPLGNSGQRIFKLPRYLPVRDIFRLLQNKQELFAHCFFVFYFRVCVDDRSMMLHFRIFMYAGHNTSPSVLCVLSRQIPDAETIAMVYNLLHYEGIFVGASSALNMVGAVKAAEALGRGKTIGESPGFTPGTSVTILEYPLALMGNMCIAPSL